MKKQRCSRRSLPLFSKAPLIPNLPPVSFDPVIAAVRVHPVTGHPAMVTFRGYNPIPGLPKIAVTIPAIVSRDPHMARSGPDYNDLTRGRRRGADAHVHLCVGRGYCECRSE